MAAIDIGLEATDRPSNSACYPAATFINIYNSANDSGVLTKFEVWTYAAPGTQHNGGFGTFYGSGGTWTNRDHVHVGDIAAGAKQTFTGLDCDVEAGDCVGVFGDPGGNPNGYKSESTGNRTFKAGDQLGAGEQSGYESYNNTGQISLWGEGATLGWANIAKVAGIAAGDAAKVLGIAVADVAKLNGVTV